MYIIFASSCRFSGESDDFQLDGTQRGKYWPAGSRRQVSQIITKLHEQHPNQRFFIMKQVGVAWPEERVTESHIQWLEKGEE